MGCIQVVTHDDGRGRQDEANAVVAPSVRCSLGPCHGRLLGQKIRVSVCSFVTTTSKSRSQYYFLCSLDHHRIAPPSGKAHSLTTHHFRTLHVTRSWTVAGASGPSRRRTGSVRDEDHDGGIVEYKVEVLTSSKYPAPTGGTKCIELIGPRGSTGEMPLEKLGQTRRSARHTPHPSCFATSQPSTR